VRAALKVSLVMKPVNRTPLRPSSLISLVALLLIAITIVGAGLIAWDQRAATIARSRQEMASLGMVLAEETTRSVQAIDLVLQELQRKASVVGLDNAERFETLMGTEAMHQYLKSRLRNLPQAQAVAVIGASGRVVNGSRLWPIPIIDLADRDYYTHLRDHDDAGVFISAPVIHRATGAWSFFLARRLNSPDGEFRGLVLGVIEIPGIEGFYQAITLPPGEAVTLYRRDGTVLALYPHVEKMMGEKTPARSPFYALVAKGGGTDRMRYPDRTAGLISVHPLRDFPLVIAVTISEEALLANWHHQALLIAIAAICTIIGLLLLFRVLAAQLRCLEQSEEALRLAKERADQSRSLAEETARQLLEAQRIGKIGHWYTDETTRTTTWSPQMFELVGIPPKSALSVEEACSFVHPDDMAAYLAARRHAIEMRTTARVENRWVRPDGETRWFNIELSPKYDAAGRCRLFGTTQDITERKRAEEALKTAQQQLTDAIESISEGFALFDREDRYVLTNSNYRRLYPGVADLCVPGTPFETVVRANVDRNLHEIGPEGIDTWMARLLEWHRASGAPMEQQLKDGRWVRAIERRTNDGGIVGIRTDITAVKQTELALRQRVADLEEARLELTGMATDLAVARDAAETANRAKSEFLANVSHELRTPLNAILGFSEMLTLKMAGPLQRRQLEKIEIIRQSGKHLLEIINDILDLAKVDAGKLDLHEEADIEPRRIVDTCVELVKERAREGMLKLSVEVQPGMPFLRADSTRLKQILLNLLSNAVKFTLPGGSIVVAGRHAENGSVALEVRDTGPGMTPTEIEIALEPFGQIDGGLARRHEGTGLGLPLARRLVELHDGLFHIDSEKGRGTTVTITLPATRVLAGPALHTAPQSAVAA